MGLPPEELSTVEDLLANEAFRTWLTERRPEHQAVWRQWLEENPDKRDIYEEAVATFLVIQGKQISISDENIDEKRKEILNRIETKTARVIPLSGIRRTRWLTTAAAVSLLFMLWWVRPLFPFSLWKTPSQPVEVGLEGNWNLFENKSQKPMVVLLPDNSSVLLSPESHLRFPKQAGPTKREVYLEGEGFFEVVRDPVRPFYVYTRNLTTKVLGTSFRVHSFDDENTSFVKVNTGKVAVTPVFTKSRTVFLSKNEQFSLELDDEKIVRQDVKVVPAQVSAREADPFSFEYTPLSDVFGRLEDTYNIEIQYDPGQVGDCTFTGQLNGVPFLEKLKLICLATDSSYEVVDRTVVIHSTGCH